MILAEGTGDTPFAKKALPWDHSPQISEDAFKKKMELNWKQNVNVMKARNLHISQKQQHYFPFHLYHVRFSALIGVKRWQRV